MARPLPPAPAPVACVAEVVVRLGDTLLDVRHLSGLRRGRARRVGVRYRIGEGHGVDLPLALAGLEDDGGATLVEVSARGVVLGLFAGIDGEIHGDGEVLSIAALRDRAARLHPLPVGARAELRCGDLKIEVRALAAEAAPQVSLARPALDRGLVRAQALSLALLGSLFVVLAHLTPAIVDPEEDFAAERQRIVAALASLPAPPQDAPSPPRTRPAPATERTPAPATPPRLERGPRLVDRGQEVEVDGQWIPAPLAPQTGWSRPLDRGMTPASEQGALLGDAAARWIAEVETQSREHYRDTREDRDAWAARTSGPPDMSRGAGGLDLKAVVVDSTASGAVGITDEEIAATFMAQRAQARRRPRDDRFRERPTLARAKAEDRTVASTSSFAFGVGGPSKVAGSLAQEHADAVVKHNRPHLARCWTDARRRDPDLKARLSIAVTVSPKGKVKRVEVPSALADPELGRCLALAIREWRYEAPPDGEASVVTYALSFGGA